MYEQVSAVLLVAWTLFHEARGEGYAGMHAVASVMYHEAHGQVGDIPRLVQRPKRWQCWMERYPADLYVRRTAPPVSNPAWTVCLSIASELLEGRFVPSTSATHYCRRGTAPGYWSRNGMRCVTTIGNHEFWLEPRMLVDRNKNRRMVR